jgi:hypothetical protein
MDVECIYSFFLTTPTAFTTPPTIEIRTLSGVPDSTKYIDIEYNNGSHHAQNVTVRWYENFKGGTGVQLAVTSAAAANPAFTISNANFSMAPLYTDYSWSTPS